MNRRLAGLLAALALIAAAPATSATADSHGSQVVTAKKCRSGHPQPRHAGRQNKRVRAGKKCVHTRGHRQAHRRHGSHCKKNGHLGRR
jgi:hypothetical protein